MCRSLSILATLVLLAGAGLAANQPSLPALGASASAEVVLTGQVFTGAGIPVPNAAVQVGSARATSDTAGDFRIKVNTGTYKVSVSASGYAAVTLSMTVNTETELRIQMAPSAALSVVSKRDELASDASATTFTADQLPPSSPGLPGVPLPLPGFPSETASGGVKAPQYFAPGVAGDHGEPIAQYIRVGDFLFPNNLPGNAHGNGYADPNLLIADAVADADIDSGAFDVRHGNNAVNLAVAYGLRPRLEPFLQWAGDARDYDMVAGWSPQNQQTAAWLALEVAGGNGLLRLPERRRQSKINGERSYQFGPHLLTFLAAGYYGSSRMPGLAPIDVRLPFDTIDARQSAGTNTSLLVVSDAWQISTNRRAEFSGYFRTYGLSLKSNFGDGLIRQSEFRTVEGGTASYQQQVGGDLLLQAGLDLRHDAPRDVELARADVNGVFHTATLGSFTVTDAAPYVSVNGALSKYVGYTVGVRRDEVGFDNIDKLIPANSYHAHSGVTSPRAVLAIHPPQGVHVPALAFSYGEAFHTNDPRIGFGIGGGTAIAKSRAYQLVGQDSIAGTELRVTVARVSNSQQLARIDPDTGLPQDVGPSVVRSLTVSARRRFRYGSLQASFARATAANPLTRKPVPEAPRLIWSLNASADRLPWGVRAKGGIEYVGRIPLGDGFTAVPVREIRGSFTRGFGGHLDAGIHFLLAGGYTGQTLEAFQLAGEPAPLKRIVGVKKVSYAGVTVTYRFGREQRETAGAGHLAD